MQIHTLSNLERIHGLDVPRPLIVALINVCAGICGRIMEFAARRRAAIQARRDRAAFLAMPDYMLRDIGVLRDEIAWSDFMENELRR
jgi:uncharacterized protein YjiS (DUF1127 family)